MATILTVNAQSGSIPVAKIQKLLNKAVGQKYVNVGGNDEKITKQVLAETTYTLYFTQLTKYGSKWVRDYSNIQWDKGFTHFFGLGYGNDKLMRYEFTFEKKIDEEFHVEGETSDKRTTSFLTFYILAKDATKMNSLIKSK